MAYVVQITRNDGTIAYQEDIYGAVDLQHARTFATEKAATASARYIGKRYQRADVYEVKLTLVDPPAWEE